MPIVPTDSVQSVMPHGLPACEQVHAKPDEFGVRLAHTLELVGRGRERDALDRINGTNVKSGCVSLLSYLGLNELSDHCR
ncbi:MAG: hypothetical protein ACLP3B_22380 [Syntrophobacteraceae bacterium]